MPISLGFDVLALGSLVYGFKVQGGFWAADCRVSFLSLISPIPIPSLKPILSRTIHGCSQNWSPKGESGYMGDTRRTGGPH